MPFNETHLFQDSNTFGIKQQVKEQFYNISQIMNCVECEKCKTYGKMQVQGLGTALKLLFDDKYGMDSGLRRNEFIALVNTMARWSDSLLIADKVWVLRDEHSNQMILFSSFAFLGVTIFTWVALMAYKGLIARFKHSMGVVRKMEKL
jgi:ERO1-like protein alpha